MTWVRRLRALVVLIGFVAGIFGVAYAVNGMTHAPGYVRVPVTVATRGEMWDPMHVPVELSGVDVTDGWLTGAPPAGSRFRLESGAGGPDSRLTLTVWGSTRVEQLLARGDALVGGLGLLVGALALRPVLESIADGRPFAPGNARRLVVLAATIAVAGVLAPLLPQVAGALVLDRTGLAGPDFVSAPSAELTPLLVAALVLTLAAAFRAGERMSDDVRGLV